MHLKTRILSVGLVLAMARDGLLAAQTTNPPYLAQFPTVEKVKQAMKADDPRETALRQMGAFWQLEHIMKALSGPREFRGLLPDEQRVLGEYQVASYYIGQAIDSAFPGRYGNSPKVSMNTPYGYSRSDPRFGVEGIETFRLLLTPQIQDAFYQVIGAEQSRRAARARQDSLEMLRAKAAAEGGGSAGVDPETRQIRRCAEAGRNQLQCVTEGIGRAWGGFIGVIAPGLKPAPIFGVRMSGIYRGPNGVRLTFYNDAVTVGCSDLVPASTVYSIGLAADGARITVHVEPRPLVLTMRPDGRLAGPGPADITGMVQTGIQFGTRTWSDGRTEPISRPVYEKLTRRCNVGELALAGASPPLGSLSTAPATLLNTVFGSPDPEADKPTPPGLRMSGEYGSQSDVDFEFRPEGVVVGCRDATTLRPYTVQVTGGRALIQVQTSTPLTVALGADGKLTGSGTLRVDGRRVTGTDGSGGLVFAPRSDSCTLGVIAPAPPRLSEAELGAAAARGSLGAAAGAGAPGPVVPAPLGPAGKALPAPTAANAAQFQLESGFPTPSGAPNPFFNQTFLLLDVPLDRIVQEAGVTQAAGQTAAKVLERACTTAAGHQDCNKLLTAMNQHEVATLKPNQAGVAQSPELPAGRNYYLFGAVITGGRKYTWNLALAAKAGWTKVTLGTANAVP